ncbi:hypothetical protein [Paraburkholderia sp.]|uniref:hypothetical protein n=1 Tax=Paraburkholderia sp. TaxID=1926495 RepID=UPI003C7B19C1
MELLAVGDITTVNLAFHQIRFRRHLHLRVNIFKKLAPEFVPSRLPLALPRFAAYIAGHLAWRSRVDRFANRRRVLGGTVVVI